MLQSRMQRELRLLANDPPPGVWAALKDGHRLTELEAQLQGPADSVYAGGVFKLSVDIPPRYPIEPPKVRFVTPIYHPNIDPEGRICLDILNPPPKGSWKPSLNISTVLASIGLLLAAPNPDDGLVAETSQEYKHQRSLFDMKARQWTKRHAMNDGGLGEVQDDDETATHTRVDGGASEPAAASHLPQQQQPQDEDASNKRVLSPAKPNLRPSGQENACAAPKAKKSKLSLQR